MPVYAYTCRDCGTPLEVHQEFSDTALTVCPVCGGALRKQYGSIGVTFNGSGFYRTDSRAGSNSESSAGSSPSKDAKPSESKSESAPAKSEPAAKGSPPASTGSATPSK